MVEKRLKIVGKGAFPLKCFKIIKVNIFWKYKGMELCHVSLGAFQKQEIEDLFRASHHFFFSPIYFLEQF